MASDVEHQRTLLHKIGIEPIHAPPADRITVVNEQRPGAADRAPPALPDRMIWSFRQTTIRLTAVAAFGRIGSCQLESQARPFLHGYLCGSQPAPTIIC